jgi:hypothetical protein
MRSGVILPMVLVFLCILGILVFTFTHWATQSKRTSWMGEQEEITKRIVESAIDETYSVINTETQNPDSSIAGWLMDRSRTESKTFELPQLPATKMLIEELRSVTPTRVSALTVTASKRTEDFRNYRNTAAGRVTYYGNEGHGTLSLIGTITITHGSRNIRRQELERHHDYKVVCLVSDRNATTRTSAQNRNLDYLLYARDGYQEFRDTAGAMLNNNSVDLEFRPNGRGKIYFGGTSQASSFIFVNLSPDYADKMPTDEGTKNLDAGEKEDLVDKVLAEPEAKEKIKQEMGAPDDEMVESEAKKEAAGDSITIKSSNLPFSKAPVDKEKEAREKLFADPKETNDPIDNAEVGIRLVPKSDVPHQVLEGHVRQRFLKVVEVEPKGIIQTMLNMLPEKLNFLLAFSVKDYEDSCKRRNKTPSKILVGIYKFLEKLRPDTLKSAVTKADDELPYGSQSESDRKPTQEKLPTLSEDFTAFSFFNLRAYSVDDLAKYGILKGNILKLSGAIHVTGPVVLGESGPITIEGRGIISTSSTITVKAGISSASPGNVLILSTKSNIIISTSDVIQAGIVANSVEVKSGCGFHLKGSLFVERLGSANWGLGPHVLEYDESRFYQEKDLMTVAVSPRITFIRMTTGE